jgi:hypothetical protein
LHRAGVAVYTPLIAATPLRFITMRALLSVLLALCSLCLGGSFPAETERTADVIVYGGTASGVIAAVAAAREGKKVILIEPGKHVGGMVSGGLGATDTGNRACIGGYSREFFNRVRDYYVKKYGADSQQVKDCSDGFRFEPHVAELIFKEMLKETKVEVLFSQHPLVTVAVNGSRVDHITTKQGNTDAYVKFKGAVYVDASYEGDLMAGARVKYSVGRESRADFNESIAGVQVRSPAHQWPVPVSAKDDKGKLLPLIQSEPAGEAGQGDKRVQAYNFRLCMTDRKDNQVPWPKPNNYHVERYELLARYLAKRPDVKLGQLCNPVRMPNGKTDTNNNGPVSTDHIGMNWSYPEGNAVTRQDIWDDHVEYTKGFFWFLAHDPRVPKKLQEEVNAWGLAKDEFTDTNQWPHQLYVREARRMLGVYFMTQADIMENRVKDESVGLGSYNTDSHHVQRVVDRDGNVLNEGDFQVRVQPYAIPYGCLTPKKAECENLLVPVCCSASHVAYGTIRMEPVYMILGQASGVAAAMACDGKGGVQAVSVPELQKKLKAQKAVLSPEGLGNPAAAKGLDAAKLDGIVVDDVQAAKTGDWASSSSIPGFVGVSYLHDSHEDKGKKSLRFKPTLPKPDQYEVFVWFTPNPNRATNVPIVIHIAGQEFKKTINQREKPKDGQRVSLGKYEFPAGEQSWVEIRTTGTDGHVIGDAVQWVKVY